MRHVKCFVFRKPQSTMIHRRFPRANKIDFFYPANTVPNIKIFKKKNGIINFAVL